MTGPRIAIVGAGPAGCYTADQLTRRLPDARIDVYDRLPTPYGLVRGGVAPDHQGTKAIVRQFERTFARENVRFRGNVEVGRDVAYADLKAAYHAVVIASGALEDRRLDIPGEDLAGVYGSGRFVGWYNGIPDCSGLAPRLDGPAAAIIGNGNVALDIARILGKTPAELSASDICTHAVAQLAQAGLTDIYLIGRRGPCEAAFSAAELAELGRLERVAPCVDAPIPVEPPVDWDEARRKAALKNLEILRNFAAAEQSGKPLRLHFLFQATPVAIEGQGAVATLKLSRRLPTDGQVTEHALPVSTVITAIGYRASPIPGVPFDTGRGIVKHEEGRVESGVWTTGWCKRGPQGVIPANRSDALATADAIAASLAATAQPDKPGGGVIDTRLRDRGIQVVDFAGWRRIDAHEVAAGQGKPREKLVATATLLAAARQPETAR